MMARDWTWSDIESAFLDAMAQHGLSPTKGLPLAADGKIHRYTVSGDRSKSDNGWYVLYDGGIPAGAFGSWKTGQNEDWCIGSGRELTAEEKAEFKARMAEAKRDREAETRRVRDEAQGRSKKLWDQARPATDAHPYLQSKRARAYGLRALGEQLLVPVRSESGKLVSLQFIGADGSKRFITGGEKLGHYCAIGKPGEVLCIAEGYATAASILEATGYAVAIAFDAGNLLPVAKAMRTKFPDTRIVICADNDAWTKTPVDNPGRTKATEAARAINGSVAWPEFSDEFIAVFEREKGGKPTDFNDLCLLGGVESVRETLARALGDGASNVYDIQGAHLRKAFEQEIEAITEPEEGEALALRIRESGLTEAAKNRLYEQIKKKTGLLIKDLRGPAKKPPHEHFGERPGDYVPELNERFAVTPFGGKVYIMSLERDPLMDRRLVKFYGKEDFHLLHSNRRTLIGGEFMPISAGWLLSPDRAQYDGVVFAPSEISPRYFNLWAGWGTQPASDDAPGEITEFMEFLFVQICARDESKYDYLLNWIAHLFQKPMELPEIALVLRSGEGTGKNTLVDTLAQLVGQAYYVVLSSVSQVTGQFSGHLADTLLVFANEAIWGGDKSAQGTLKAMICDKVLPVERKGKDIITMPNYKRLIFASNEGWVVPRGLDDRRFAVFDISEEHKQDEAYFATIRGEMADPGFLPALMRYFMRREITDWHPRRLPPALKEAGWDMKYLSADSVTRWWMSCLTHGMVQRGNRHHKADDTDTPAAIWPGFLPKLDVHQAYLAWCQMHQISRPKEDYLFGKEMSRFGIIPKRKRKKADVPGADNRVQMYFFPTVDEAREVFSKEVGLSMAFWSIDEHDAD